MGMEKYPYVHTSDIILSVLITTIRPESLRSKVKLKLLSRDNLFHKSLPISSHFICFVFGRLGKLSEPNTFKLPTLQPGGKYPGYLTLPT